MRIAAISLLVDRSVDAADGAVKTRLSKYLRQVSETNPETSVVRDVAWRNIQRRQSCPVRQRASVHSHEAGRKRSHAYLKGGYDSKYPEWRSHVEATCSFGQDIMWKVRV